MKWLLPGALALALGSCATLELGASYTLPGGSAGTGTVHLDATLLKEAK